MTLEEKQRLLQGIGPARPADDGSLLPHSVD